MAGVSAALPFVIGGGILVALANMLVQFGLPYTDMSKGAPSFTWWLNPSVISASPL